MDGGADDVDIASSCSDDDASMSICILGRVCVCVCAAPLVLYE